MSVHQESLDLSKAITRTADEAPELEYSRVRTDSLMMFGAALGGAILGMLLTLLMLAIINGGTLNFSGGARQIETLEANLSRVNENVGAVSANIDTISLRASEIQSQLSTVETNLRAELAAQGGEITGISDALSTLDTTRRQFDLFVTAMNGALSDMNSLTTTGETKQDAAAAETAVQSAPVADAELPMPVVQSSVAVGPQAIQVQIFADANRDSLPGADETNLIGFSVSLVNSAGETVAGGMTTESGVLFEGLDAGEYTVNVDDALGYELLSAGTAGVTIAADDGQGVEVLIPVSSTVD